MSFASKSLLSAPLGSLSQPGKLLSGSEEMLSPQSLFQTTSQHSVLSVPLSSLLSQVGPHSLSKPLKTTVQNPAVLSCKPEASSLSYPTPLLSISLSTLSQTPTSQSDLLAANSVEDPLLSTSLSSLSLSSASLSSSLLLQPMCPLIASQTSETVESISTVLRAAETSSVEVQEEKHKHDTSDCLCQNLHNADSVGNSNDRNLKEKDCNHNHKEETKSSATPMILSTFNSSSVQQGTRTVFGIDEKPLASSVKLSIDICNARFQKNDLERQQSRTLDSNPPLTAKPSMFALALCNSTQASAKTNPANKPVKQNIENEINNLSSINITPFNFCSPSPDDVVNEKQKRAFSKKK